MPTWRNRSVRPRRAARRCAPRAAAPTLRAPPSGRGARHCHHGRGALLLRSVGGGSGGGAGSGAHLLSPRGCVPTSPPYPRCQHGEAAVGAVRVWRCFSLRINPYQVRYLPICHTPTRFPYIHSPTCVFPAFFFLVEDADPHVQMKALAVKRGPSEGGGGSPPMSPPECDGPPTDASPLPTWESKKKVRTAQKSHTHHHP